METKLGGISGRSPAPSSEVDEVEVESPATPRPTEASDSLAAAPAPDETLATELPSTDEAEVQNYTPEEKSTVRVPAEEGGGVRQVTGTALYRTNGPEQSTGQIATPVSPQ